eukprot:6488433-Amphidinium_carterae.1
MGGRTALEKTMTTLTVAMDRVKARRRVPVDDLLLAEDDQCVARELGNKSKARAFDAVALTFECDLIALALSSQYLRFTAEPQREIV